MRRFIIKNFRGLANIIMILFTLPAIFLLVRGTFSSNTAITIIVLEVFVFTGLSSFLKQLLMKQTLNILFTECDPYRFLDEAEMFLNSEKNKAMKLNFLNWKLIGLRNCNNADEAEKVQKEMESKFNDKMPKGLKATFAVSFTSHYIFKNEFSQAEEWMKKAEEISKDKSFKLHETKRIYKAIQMNRCQINILMSKFEGCEEKLKETIEFETRKSNLIAARYLLGKLYFKQKRFDEAKTEFEFVIENGNKLLEVEEAQHMNLTL